VRRDLKERDSLQDLSLLGIMVRARVSQALRVSAAGALETCIEGCILLSFFLFSFATVMR
jgi:hypothetical protein